MALDDPTPEPQDPPDDPTPDPPDDPTPTPADPKPKDDGIDWKAMARKHEREAKKAREEAKAHAAKLAEIEASNLSDQEKAIAKAREEAKAEATAEGQEALRRVTLEAAVTRAAVGRGVKIDDKTVKFDDGDDVHMWLKDRIAKGELDGLFDDDGNVNMATLDEALVELATAKPKWLAGNGSNGSGTPAGDPDAGKGAPARSSASVEDEFQSIRRSK